MAESARTSLTRLRPLGEMVVPEAVFLLGVHQNAELLRDELRRMQIFVRDADARRCRSVGFNKWVVDVRAAAHDSEDVLEEADLLERRRDLQRGWWSCLCSVPLAWCADLVALHMLGVKIRRLLTWIAEINQGAVYYGFTKLGDEATSSIAVCPQDVTPHDLGWVAGDGDYTWVVGFHKERDEIIRELTDTKALEICVACIVGMGGSGKSTLARKIYHFLHGEQHFEAFCWLTVSQKYTFLDLIKDAAKKIMNIKRYKVEEERNRHGEGTSKDGGKKNQLTVETLEKMHEVEVKELLREELAHRRFLIVLDDVWRCNSYSEINKIINVFPDVNNGSRIMLTTRDLNVAQHVNKMNSIHQLQLLDQEQSWELLQKKAFQRHQLSSFSDSDRSWLTRIGQKLAMKCHGLPLALEILGGYLSRNLDCHIWSGLVDDLDWEFRNDHGPIGDILSTSYNGLRQYQLKSCFLYLASFPGDHIICVKRLIKLLIAEGFVPERHNRTMEDTAREYINELAQWSMLQIVGRSKVDGSIKSVVLNDILRDWAIKEANREGFFNIWCHTTTVPCEEDFSMPAYRLALHNYSGRWQIAASASMPKVRTLWLHGSSSKDLVLGSLTFLRVLDLYGIEGLERLPSCIGKLIHLRYLGLKDCGKAGSIDIPPSVVDLLNLQTIDARNSRIASLPRYFWDLTTFRHIHLEDVYNWAAPGVGRLLSVQTFHFSGVCLLLDIERALTSKERRSIRNSNIADSKENYREWTIMIAALKEMKQLVFLHLENWYSVQGARKTATFPSNLITELSLLKCLRVLELHGGLSSPIDHFAMLPCKLKKLKLVGSKLLEDPLPVLGKLPNLVVLTLEDRSYEGEKMTCEADGFPRLKYLTFEEVSNVRHWDIEVGAFPSLIQLKLVFSFQAEMTVPPRGLLHVKSLQELHLHPRTAADVSLQNIETLRGMGCKVNVKYV